MNGRLVKTKITFEVTQTSGSSETRRHMRDSGRVFIKMCMSRSSHIRESKTVLDSGFHLVDSGFLEQKIPGSPYVGRSRVISWNHADNTENWRNLVSKHFFIYFQIYIEKQELTQPQRSLPSIDADTRPKVSLYSLVMDKDNINSTFSFPT